MRFSGFADREPQPTGSTDSGSGSSVVGFELYVVVGFELYIVVGFELYIVVGFRLYIVVGFELYVVGFELWVN